MYKVHLRLAQFDWQGNCLRDLISAAREPSLLLVTAVEVEVWTLVQIELPVIQAKRNQKFHNTNFTVLNLQKKYSAISLSLDLRIISLERQNYLTSIGLIAVYRIISPFHLSKTLNNTTKGLSFYLYAIAACIVYN